MQMYAKILQIQTQTQTQIKPNNSNFKTKLRSQIESSLSKSMSLRQQKLKYQNYLTLNNGCKIITNGAKPLHHNNPENILTDNMRQLWLSKEIPAICVIDLRNILQKPACWNRIGFICWHQYDSNPKLIEVQYTGQDNPQNAVWVVLAKIRLQLTSNWQHFKLPVTPSKNVSFIKLKIMQNHSQPQAEDEASEAGTYLNQVSLGFVQEIIQSRVQLTAANNMRQKTFSDYRKIGLSNNQNKEVKRLGERVKQLSNDNEVMRRTIDHQNSIIIKLQEAIQTLVGNVGRLQQRQKAQQKRVKQLEKERSYYRVKYGSDDKHLRKQEIQEYFNDESQIAADKSEEKHHSHQRGRSHNTSGYEQSSQLSRTNKQSIQRSHKGTTMHKQGIKQPNNNTRSNNKSQHNRSRHSRSQHSKSNRKQQNNNNRNKSNKGRVINGNIDESEESMSEYEGVVDERVYRNGKREEGKGKEGVYIPMLQKLQQLIMLREQKKNRLKTNKKHKRSSKIIVSSSDGDDDDNDFQSSNDHKREEQ